MKVELKKCRVEYIDKESGETKSNYQFRIYYKEKEYIVIKNVFKNDYNILKVFADDE